MKSHFYPGAWPFFGFVGYPIVCVINEILWILTFAPSAFQSHPFRQFGYQGGGGGLLMGPPLGVLTELIAYCVDKEKRVRARILAVIGGSLGVLAVLKIAPPSVNTYGGDFGFVATPFLWCAALILWGCMARSPKN